MRSKKVDCLLRQRFPPDPRTRAGRGASLEPAESAHSFDLRAGRACPFRPARQSAIGRPFPLSSYRPRYVTMTNYLGMQGYWSWRFTAS
jgi:hypothetical protein